MTYMRHNSLHSAAQSLSDWTKALQTLKNCIGWGYKMKLLQALKHLKESLTESEIFTKLSFQSIQKTLLPLDKNL